MFFNVGNTSYETSGDGDSYSRKYHLPSGEDEMCIRDRYIPYWTEERPSNKYPAANFSGDGRFKGLQSRAFVRLQDITCLLYTSRCV